MLLSHRNNIICYLVLWDTNLLCQNIAGFLKYEILDDKSNLCNALLIQMMRPIFTKKDA